MASLKEMIETNMTDYQKERARIEAQTLVLELIDSNISFRLSSGAVGCYTIVIPDEAGDHASFYFSDRVFLYRRKDLQYQSDWCNHSYAEMLKVFVNL